MVKMKYLIVGVLCLSLAVHDIYGAMSEAQLKATLKMVKNVCQPKSKATDEQIEAMHKGEWDQDKNGQCYVHCILTMYKLIRKDNSFDWQAGIKTMETNAPPKISKPGIKSIESCKDAVKTPSDKCTASLEIAKCIYEDNPENYFFP